MKAAEGSGPAGHALGETQQPPLHFKVHGMDCAEDVSALKREVGRVVGGDDRLSFDLLKARMTVRGGAPLPAELILRAVARAGLRAEAWTEETGGDADGRQPRGRAILTAASGVFSLAGFVLHAWLTGGVSAALGTDGLGGAHEVPLGSEILYTLGIVTGAWYVVPRAWAAARRLRPDMNLLMTVAVAGAVGIGEWFEAATVSFLFAVSLALEAWSVGRARRAIAALLDLAPPTAHLVAEGGREEEVGLDQVRVGSLFVVKPGERIPLDGRVARGTSDVNQAPVTGESRPVGKHPGDPVFAGTVNGDGMLVVESTRPATDTTLARIIRMVEEAQSRRAPSEQWVDRFARVYTPAVMGLAVVVLLVPPLALDAPWHDWIYRALVLLVVGCPCALVISTPVSIVAALTAAARNGVLVKGGAYLEAPARLEAIAIDKTGTLTEGRASVVEVVPLGGHGEAELLGSAAALEARTTHPLAAAILAYAKARGVDVRPAEDLKILQGKGATGRLDGKRYWLGSHRYLEEHGQETEEVHRALETMSRAGRSVVVVGNDAHVCGLIAVADALRPEAKSAIQALREAGVHRVVMLTGDNAATARAIGREAGIDEVYPELLPADKVAVVEDLVSRHGVVAMVGDGINDAPAMARATLGIAMGAAGSDAAIETADVALMSDDLARLPWLVRHSRRTLAIIRQNIGLSLCVKGLFVVLTFLGYASLWTAIAADMGASLLVTLNGLRLLKQREPRGSGPADVAPPRAFAVRSAP